MVRPKVIRSMSTLYTPPLAVDMMHLPRFAWFAPVLCEHDRENRMSRTMIFKPAGAAPLVSCSRLGLNNHV